MRFGWRRLESYKCGFLDFDTNPISTIGHFGQHQLNL